jgi:hypothetical protein
VAINDSTDFMTMKISIKNEWTYREFITVLFNFDRSEVTQQHLDWLLKKPTSTAIEKYRHQEIDSKISKGHISNISKITSHIKEFTPSYNTDKKLSIAFWMRVGVHLSVHYQENIDNLINIYCQWKNEEGRDYVLIAKQKNGKSTDTSYSLDAFIARGAFRDKGKAIPEEEWKIINAELLEIKQNINKPKDPYRGIGKYKYLELQKVIEISVKSASIKSLRPKTGPNGTCEYNNNREELYKELLAKYELTLTISSFNKAIADFVKCYPKGNMPILTNRMDAFHHKQFHKKEMARKKFTSLDNIKRLSE